MPLVIDTYNVLHTQGVLPPEIAGVGVRGLIDLLSRSRYRSKRTILVCDGFPAENGPSGRLGAVTVQYAGRLEADDLIHALIRKSTSPRNLTVVSSDRAIVREARKRRCATINSASFLRRLADDHAATEGATATGKGRGGGRPSRGPRPADGDGVSGRRRRSVLPTDLIAEAEAIERRLAEELGADAGADAGAGESTDESTDAGAGPASDAPGIDQGPSAAETPGTTDERPGRGGRRPRRDDDPLPPEVLAEAERLWRSGLED